VAATTKAQDYDKLLAGLQALKLPNKEKMSNPAAFRFYWKPEIELSPHYSFIGVVNPAPRR